MNIREESIDSVTALAARLVASQFPQWRALPVRPVEHQGNDNRTFRLGDELIVRMPSAKRYVAAVEKEHAWLPRLRPRLPLQIPIPIALGEPGEGYLWRWSVYRWLDGETTNAARLKDPTGFAASLAEFLLVLHRVDPDGGPPAGVHTFFRGASLAVYDDQTRQAIKLLSDTIDAQRATRAWDTALAASWTGKPVWFHGDVAVTNLLLREGKLGAVIDFGASGVGDPACDLAIAWSFFDRNMRAVFKSTLPLDASTWMRGRGWALWKALIVMTQRRSYSPEQPQESIWTHNPMTGRLVVDEVIADE